MQDPLASQAARRVEIGKEREREGKNETDSEERKWGAGRESVEIFGKERGGGERGERGEGGFGYDFGLFQLMIFPEGTCSNQ